MLSLLSLLGGMGHIRRSYPCAACSHVPARAGACSSNAALAAGRVERRARRGGIGGAGVSNVPWWNAFSIMIFLCWFGAAGYLLTRYGSFVAGVVLVMSLICGLAGGAIMFIFLAKVLLPHERELTADETAVVGAVGRVSSAIRAGGTGEIDLRTMGARRSARHGRKTARRLRKTLRCMWSGREGDRVRAEMGRVEGQRSGNRDQGSVALN